MSPRVVLSLEERLKQQAEGVVEQFLIPRNTIQNYEVSLVLSCQVGTLSCLLDTGSSAEELLTHFLLLHCALVQAEKNLKSGQFDEVAGGNSGVALLKTAIKQVEEVLAKHKAVSDQARQALIGAAESSSAKEDFTLKPSPPIVMAEAERPQARRITRAGRRGRASAAIHRFFNAVSVIARVVKAAASSIGKALAEGGKIALEGAPEQFGGLVDSTELDLDWSLTKPTSSAGSSTRNIQAAFETSRQSKCVVIEKAKEDAGHSATVKLVIDPRTGQSTGQYTPPNSPARDGHDTLDSQAGDDAVMQSLIDGSKLGVPVAMHTGSSASKSGLTVTPEPLSLNA